MPPKRKNTTDQKDNTPSKKPKSDENSSSSSSSSPESSSSDSEQLYDDVNDLENLFDNDFGDDDDDDLGNYDSDEESIPTTDEDEDENEPPPKSPLESKIIFIINKPKNKDPPSDNNISPFTTINPFSHLFGGGNQLDPPTTSSSRRRKPPPRPKRPIKRTKVEIKEKITSIQDLIDVAKKYPNKPTLKYPFDIGKAKLLIPPLQELDNMIGLNDIKLQIFDNIRYLLAELKDPDQMLHTVIYGPPGSGKTMLANILAKIYAALGYANGKFKSVKRSDLIAGYLGQTAMKTQKAIDEARGGVLFIDEAYALGNKEGRDSFSKEAIDTLNANLTERKTEFICIIAGYKQELDECFFASNPGLNRRFPFRYEIKAYGAEQLRSIFHTKLTQTGWEVPKESIPLRFFEDNLAYFPYKGGDMENLSQMTKIAYSRRLFGTHIPETRQITYDDILEGFQIYLNSDEVKSRKDKELKERTLFQSMYI